MYEQGEILSIDIDELGIRPSNWIDVIKKVDDSTIDYFRTEKTCELAVYSSELQFTNNEKKSTADDDNSSMSDEEYSNNYEIDPETGEKIFHTSGFTASSPVSTPNDKWIDEYLSTIEASSNQTLPNTTTADTIEIMLDNNPMSLFDNIFDHSDSDWFSSIFNFEGDNNNNILPQPLVTNEFIDTDDLKSNEIQVLSSSSSSNSVSSIETNYTTGESVLMNPSSILADDEYSNTSVFTLVDAKLEKIDVNEEQAAQIMQRRTSVRSKSQKQQDEEALRRFNIPLHLNDITESNTDDYNRLLARLSYLSSEQIHIIKDIRRRGKNKIAAQNCRKRKAVGVESLAEEVDELKRVKLGLEEQKRAFQQQIMETRRQYEHLHRQILPDHQLPPAIMVK